jgi:hypothetical protein
VASSFGTGAEADGKTGSADVVQPARTACARTRQSGRAPNMVAIVRLRVNDRQPRRPHIKTRGAN